MVLSTYVESYKNLLIPTPLSEQCLEESSNAVCFCGRYCIYLFYTYFVSNKYLNIISCSDSSPFWTEKCTVLGMSNVNCCSTFSILSYEKHLNTGAKASFYFCCSARVSMVNEAGAVMGGIS